MAWVSSFSSLCQTHIHTYNLVDLNSRPKRCSSSGISGREKGRRLTAHPERTGTRGGTPGESQYDSVGSRRPSGLT